MIRLVPLFSGSRGNCTLLQTSQCNVLLDCGYGFRAIADRLKMAGVDVEDISAVVVTHEHGDHVSALPYLVKYAHPRIFAPIGTGITISTICCCEVVEVEESFEIDGTLVDVYQCSHDSRNCFGYRFSDGKSAVASVTDTGFASDKLVPFLAPCHSIILESNHDTDMLNNGPYPYFLKQRILSDRGHLSNVQATRVLQDLVGSNVKNVVLAHLSQQNNTPSVAYQTACDMYTQAGVLVGKDVKLYVADQYKNEVIL